MVEGDICDSDYRDLSPNCDVAIDIETTGLSELVDELCTVQICAETRVIIIRPTKRVVPRNLVSIIENSGHRKVFHHAAFDLRFLCKTWAVVPSNVVCTKIAAKILKFNDTSLRHVLRQRLGVRIDKKLQLSDWTATVLSDAQIRYCADDVAYLIPLYDALEDDMTRFSLLKYAQAAFEFLPTRVRLDLLDYPDLFQY